MDADGGSTPWTRMRKHMGAIRVRTTAVAVFMTLLLGVAYRELTAHTER